MWRLNYCALGALPFEFTQRDIRKIADKLLLIHNLQTKQHRRVVCNSIRVYSLSYLVAKQPLPTHFNATNNANMYMNTQGWTPLHFAATYGREPVIMLLTKSGADASITTNDGETPLHFSAHYDHKLITIALYEAGAPLDARDKVSACMF
jgi:hypothetical protein